MPKAAAQIAGHLFGSTRPLASRSKPSVYVVRPRNQSDAGFARPPVNIRVDRSRPSSLTLSTGHQRNPYLADEEDFSVESPSIQSQKISVAEGKDGEMEITIPEDSGYFVTLDDAHMDGIHHLNDENRNIRMIWTVVIIVFAFLAVYQISNQIVMYVTTPIATNIEADYPTTINFPTVAICNNNQFRLTYLTGARVQNRRPRNRTMEIKGVNDTSDNVFDRALLNSWDMDAVKFLRNAAHWKSRMIMSCTYPNGTRCRITDFKAVWTLTGLCWAINTNIDSPVMVTGAGPSHALKLLLNVERYERIESCTPKFRTHSLPGLKILIYNQTDIPISALDGVNVPPGFTMDIPFRMQHRQKLPGVNCVQEEIKKFHSAEKIEESQDARTCKIRKYLDEIERQCACSMRRAYDPNPKDSFPFCSVMDYFDCVVPVLKWGYDGGFSSYQCMANCDEIDYIAWQDMNELPNNIFPKLIDSADDEDESDVDEDTDIDDELYVDELGRAEHFKCEDNQILEDQQVNRIKREAHRAYEKQTRYQEDILLRTKRLMTRMNLACDKVRNLKWGWRNEDFSGVFERFSNSTSCFGNMTAVHSNAFNAVNNKAFKSEEKRAKMLVHLLNKGRFLKPESEFLTINDVKHVYGAEQVDEMDKKLNFVDEYVHRLASIYDEDSYTETLTRHLERMDRILQLTEQYDSGKLQRKAWAEKMQARNMKHFFEEDFYEGWYNVITKDLDVTVGKAVADLEQSLDTLKDLIVNGTGLEIGSVLLFGDTASNHSKFFADFLNEMIDCSFGEVRDTAKNLSSEFKKAMHEFQSAYSNLFKKELPDYLENFDFGPKFVKENFAQVNVFLHKMNVEHWKQSATYSIWSLFCDVGGALGLFLGASLLTLIELLYLCCQYGIVHSKWWGVKNKWTMSKMEKMNKYTKNKWDDVRRASGRYRRSKKRSPSSEDEEDEANNEEYEVMLPVEETREEPGTRKIRFRPAVLRKFPGMIRKSLRRRPKPDTQKVSVINEEGEMDLTELRPELGADPHANLEPEKKSQRSFLTEPLSRGSSTTSRDSRNTKSAPSIQEHIIDMNAYGGSASNSPRPDRESPLNLSIHSSPPLSASTLQKPAHGTSPVIPPRAESSKNKSPSIPSVVSFPVKFHSPESETSPPKDPSPHKKSEQPEETMFKSLNDESLPGSTPTASISVPVDRSTNEADTESKEPPISTPKEENVEKPGGRRENVPVLFFPAPPEDSPPNTRQSL